MGWAWRYQSLAPSQAECISQILGTPSIIPRQHFQQFNLKDQIGVRLDMCAELALAITQVRRYEEFAFATNLHAHQALVPALDHPAGADHALEGFAAIIGGIELAAIFEKSVVLGGDQRTSDHFPAVTQLNIFDHQFVAHHSPLLAPTDLRQGC